jgi:hypothetical protein
MIKYIDKPGLDAVLQRAGFTVVESHLGFHAVRGSAESMEIDAAAQALIDGYSLDQAKAEKCNAVIEKARGYFERATATVAPAEMAGWPILRAEAMAYNADSTASCPAMTTEAQMRGCTVRELAAKVSGNTQRFDALRAAIAGNSGKHRDAVMALLTFAEVAAYDISSGWPAV